MTEPACPVVLITGASRGIGRAVAGQLARREDRRVAALLRDTEGRNADAAAELRELDVLVVDADLTQGADVDRAVAAVVDLHGGVDVVVNNAAFGLFGPVEALSTDELQQQFDVNVLGPHRVCRAVLPHMRGQGTGLLVQVSSGAGRYTLPLRGGYCASKWALEALSDCLRWELHPFGIDVVLLELGPFRSGFQASRRWAADSARSDAYEVLSEHLESDLADRTASDGYRDPSEAADAIDDLIDRPESRAWRVLVHPDARAVNTYNLSYEALQRATLESRHYGDLLPAQEGSRWQ